MSKRKITELDRDKLRELESDWHADVLPVGVIAKKFGITVEELHAYAKNSGWGSAELRGTCGGVEASDDPNSIETTARLIAKEDPDLAALLQVTDPLTRRMQR